MGLLDSILGGALGQGTGNQGNQGSAMLMQLAPKLLAGNGSQGRGGLVGTGQNVPISPEQLMQVSGAVRSRMLPR